MRPDRIIEEIRQTREAYARQFGFNLKAMYDDLKEREQKSGRTVVTFPPKRVVSESSPLLATQKAA